MPKAEQVIKARREKLDFLHSKFLELFKEMQEANCAAVPCDKCKMLKESATTTHCIIVEFDKRMGDLIKK